MPRRLPMRPAKIIGNLFVSLVFILMSFIYYTYVFLVWSPKLSSKKPNNALVNPSLVLENFLANYVLIVFNALFAMMGWSFI